MVTVHTGAENIQGSKLFAETRYLNFRLISMDGSGLTDVPLRRRVNKLFMECLEDVQHDQAAALIWLKRHIEPEICNTILSDKNYTGLQTIISYQTNYNFFSKIKMKLFVLFIQAQGFKWLKTILTP